MSIKDKWAVALLTCHPDDGVCFWMWFWFYYTPWYYLGGFRATS
jgi:hypothetical protein